MQVQLRIVEVCVELTWDSKYLKILKPGKYWWDFSGYVLYVLELLFWMYVSLLFCFALLWFCTFLLLCFSAFLPFAFLLLCFSAFLLLCFSLCFLAYQA